MEDNRANYRFRSKRQPLRDATNRANITQLSTRQTRYETASAPLEHQMKLLDSEKVLNESNSAGVIADNKRVSAVIDYHSDSKRNSAISTTSTNSARSRRKTHIGPWQLGKTLGKGSTGRVRLAKHAVTGQSAAIKIVSKKSAALAQSQSIAAMDRNIGSVPGSNAIPSGIEREVVIMKLIEHPHVISLYDVWENRGELYLVLEYVEGGELFDYVAARGRLREIEAVRLFGQIIAALSYCHQFNICHRDLKPENILLDSHRNIKLADFGMAALQPAGHWLNTSCGSPHYAAPEIIYGHRYQGDKADIWSCGIILFAMLAGCLPFDGGDLATTLKLVKKGEYILPPWFSAEAVDLIQRILQKKPENRIRIDQMWTHPLLTKYESQHIFNLPMTSTGPPPPLSSEDFKSYVSHRRDVDAEILRSLQTLWHGKGREELIETLLNDEANHEKLFYKALLRFREEQLENYEGPPLGYSSSDYHHVSRPFFRPKKRIASSHGENNGSRHSKFSIATNASGLKGSSTRGPMSARTIASYDPYRSSQTAITEPKVEYANVTIHRHMPGDSNVMMDPKSSPPFMQSSGNRTSLTVPSPKDGPWSSSRRSSLASFQSRSSMASFRQRSRPGRSYKRNVSFRHLQNQAVSNRVDIPRTHSQYFLSDDKRKLPPRQSERTNRLSTDRFSSPSLPSPQTCVRGVTNQMQTGESQGGANARKSYQYWKEEARKVSQELEQICEEAFNSSSLSSSRTTDTVSRYPESPVTSVSTPGNLNRYYANSKQEQTFESSSSYATKELAETRRRLIEHSKQASADGLPSYLSEVITHLDRLIGDGPTAITSESVTLSKESTQSGAGKLPPISEERHSVKDFFSSEGDASYLFSKPAPTKLGDWEEKKTIRAVPDSTTDLGSIKPLTIRKKRTTLELPISANETTNFHQSQRHLSDSVARNRPSGRRSTTEQFFSGLEPIEENPRSPKKSEGRNSGETRKWSWFKHKSQGCDDVGPPTPPKDGLSSGKSSMTTITHQVCQSTEWLPPLAEGDSSKLPKKSGTAEKGKKLLKLFSRRKHEKPVHEIGRGINDPDLSVTSLTKKSEEDISNVSDGAISKLSTVAPPPSQNWFMKIFNIKPASRVFALSVSKPRAKKEILKILREWKKYGMEKIRFDRQSNVLRARVGERNFLRLRPVEFSAELFTLLEYGRNVNLSLIRFKQERGAASSFRKVMDTLSVVLEQRKMVVEDIVKAKKMIKVLDHAD